MGSTIAVEEPEDVDAGDDDYDSQNPKMNTRQGLHGFFGFFFGFFRVFRVS